jgi:predicted MFS family arabinose efflux permease
MAESEKAVISQPTATLRSRIAGMSRELKLFALASFIMGIAYSMIDATLNNFLNERFALTGFERSFLEFPRELPGVLVVFVSALLWFLNTRKLGVVAMLLGVAGTILLGFVSTTYAIVVMCLFVYSIGQHLFMPVASTIGMELAREGKTGQRLGQLNALRNLAAIIGSFVVFLGFKLLNFNFSYTFALAAVGLTLAAVLLYNMRPNLDERPKVFLKLHKEYRLYYLLSILFGSRKQLFITFAPWVIVTIFNQPTQTMATLATIGGIVGILFQPLLGWAVDHLGERFVLAAEALLLVVVCFGYGFARSLFPEGTAFLLTCIFYLLDQMLLSVNMARATYIKKIALRPEDVQPALTASVTIDHTFSIVIALLGGVIWNVFGYQYVFLLGVAIAALNFFAALKIRLPKPV